MTPPLNRQRASAVTWLSGALIVMPLLQALPIDFDRSGVLVLVLPTLWAGRAELAWALEELWQRPVIALLAAIAAATTVVSIACADLPAPAAVTAASWLLLATVALIAGRIARSDAAVRMRLLEALALSSAVGAIAMWAWWLAQGRPAMPLYAHHRHLGLHALSGSVAALALAVEAPHRRRQLLWLAIGVIVWAALLWSGGRGPVLALGIATVAWVAAGPSRHRKPLLGHAAILAAGSLALSALFWTTRPELGWWHAFERTAVATRAVNVSELTSTRSEGWRESFARALSRPWAGHGPDAYRHLTPKLDGQQPHNVVLQLWLDLGFVGGSAAVILLAATIAYGWRIARTHRGEVALVAWCAMLWALAVEGLLDGVYYHMLAFLPAMLASGIVVMACTTDTATQPGAWRRLPSVAAGIAVAVLAVHTALFQALAVAEPPASPHGIMPKLLRAFPSTTYGLWRWTDAWEKAMPEEALAWDRWAETHAANAPLFHLRAAQVLIDHGDRLGAIAELKAAEAKAHWTVKPSILKMRQAVENAPK